MPLIAYINISNHDYHEQYTYLGICVITQILNLSLYYLPLFHIIKTTIIQHFITFVYVYLFVIYSETKEYVIKRHRTIFFFKGRHYSSQVFMSLTHSFFIKKKKKIMQEKIYFIIYLQNNTKCNLNILHLCALPKRYLFFKRFYVTFKP